MLQKGYNMDIKPKRSASSFRFRAKNYQSLGNFTGKVPLPNGKVPKMKTNIVPINVPFLIGHIYGTWNVTESKRPICVQKRKMEHTVTIPK